MEIDEWMDHDRSGLRDTLSAEKCIIATTAASLDDTVEVTLPNSDAPSTRIPVNWRPGVTWSGSTPSPRYPIKNQNGIVIYDDEGEAWLMW